MRKGDYSFRAFLMAITLIALLALFAILGRSQVRIVPADRHSKLIDPYYFIRRDCNPRPVKRRKRPVRRRRRVYNHARPHWSNSWRPIDYSDYSPYDWSKHTP